MVDLEYRSWFIRNTATVINGPSDFKATFLVIRPNHFILATFFTETVQVIVSFSLKKKFLIPGIFHNDLHNDEFFSNYYTTYA